MTVAAATSIDLAPQANIQLKLLEEASLARFIELVRHPAINPHLPFAPDFPESQAREMMSVSANPQSGCYAWMMVAQQDLREVGVITAMPVFHAGCLQLGYWVDAACQGRGYATLAVRMACALAFEHLGMARVQAQVVPENTASARVLQKAGFEREGRLKASHRLNDALYDTDLYAKVAA